MVDRLLGAVRALLELLRTVAGILLICSVALNFANIIGRYFFSVSISWAEEIMLFLMVGCVFLGAPGVSWSNRHIRMDVVVSMLPPAIRKLLELFADLTFIVVACLLVIYAWPVISDLAAFDERSQAANFPLVIPQALIPLGLAFMALLVAIRLLVARRHRAEPHDVPVH
jgi:TRAP-type C4-dicarboxylate transport system permease small subunit